MTDTTTKNDKKIAVFGLFDDRASLERAIDGLRTEGFRESDISALLPDRQQTAEVAHEKHTKAPEGALTGAAAGGAIGGTLGLLLGIGALAIPGYPSSRPVRSWRPSRARALAARSAP